MSHKSVMGQKLNGLREAYFESSLTQILELMSSCKILIALTVASFRESNESSRFHGDNANDMGDETNEIMNVQRTC